MLAEHVRKRAQRAHDGRPQPVYYVRSDWQRDFGETLDALTGLTVGVPSPGQVNQWLDAVDGFPTFNTRESQQAYLDDREVLSKALIAALQLKYNAVETHAVWCATRSDDPKQWRCDCGVGEIETGT